MSRAHLPIHGRNHVCGGSDPIPGICDLLRVPSGTIDEAILATEPGAYYKLDEAAGDWQDSSGANRDATYISRTGTVRGVDSELDEGDGSLCVTVDGPAPAVALGYSHVGEAIDTWFRMAGTVPFSLTARIRPATVSISSLLSMGICGTVHDTASGAVGFGFYIAGEAAAGAGNAGRPLFRRTSGLGEAFADTDVLGPNVLEVDEWVRLTATFDGAVLSFYADDTHLGDTTPGTLGSLPGAVSTDHFQIGCCGIGEGIGGTQAPFDGEIDSVAVWDRALSASEIGGIADFETGAAGSAAAGTVPTSDGAGGVVWALPTFEVEF